MARGNKPHASKYIWTPELLSRYLGVFPKKAEEVFDSIPSFHLPGDSTKRTSTIFIANYLAETLCNSAISKKINFKLDKQELMDSIIDDLRNFMQDKSSINSDEIL